MDHELAEQAVYHVWDNRTVFLRDFQGIHHIGTCNTKGWVE